VGGGFRHTIMKSAIPGPRHAGDAVAEELDQPAVVLRTGRNPQQRHGQDRLPAGAVRVNDREQAGPVQQRHREPGGRAAPVVAATALPGQHGQRGLARPGHLGFIGTRVVERRPGAAEHQAGAAGQEPGSAAPGADHRRDESRQPGPPGFPGPVVDCAGDRGEHRVNAGGVVAPRLPGEGGSQLHRAGPVVGVGVAAPGQEGRGRRAERGGLSRGVPGGLSRGVRGGGVGRRIAGCRGGRRGDHGRTSAFWIQSPMYSGGKVQGGSR
jgi:hypothetical protein